jgi:hypothetical protein
VHNFTYAASTANKPHLFNLKIIIMKLLKTLLFLALFSISFSSCNDLEDDDNTQSSKITETAKASGDEVDLPDGTKD